MFECSEHHERVTANETSERNKSINANKLLVLVCVCVSLRNTNVSARPLAADPNELLAFADFSLYLSSSFCAYDH